ncbi:MAG: hypothetical protein LC792_11060 [Actinobacteria bacterium]|nr:hypothetical protein [Actinomycetota bacterium]
MSQNLMLWSSLAGTAAPYGPGSGGLDTGRRAARHHPTEVEPRTDRFFADSVRPPGAERRFCA